MKKTLNNSWDFFLNYEFEKDYFKRLEERIDYEYSNYTVYPQKELIFNTFGLWKRCRHPNYLGEQMIWISLFLFVIGANLAKYYVFNWSSVGALLLVLLFLGSSTLGESISASKYPEYDLYTKSVCRYLPLWDYDPEK